jgi:hypothetical protein
MRLFSGSIIAVACGVLLCACGDGMVRRVSEPAASIQQLSVLADGSWSLDLRLQNYSSIPMHFDKLALDINVGEQPAGKLEQSIDFSIGPESADVVNLKLQPHSLAKLTVADVLASRPGQETARLRSGYAQQPESGPRPGWRAALSFTPLHPMRIPQDRPRHE